MRETSSRCIDALLSSCSDGDNSVRLQTIKSISLLANKDLVSVTRQCEQWLTLRKPSTTSTSHRFVVVRTIITLLRDHKARIKSTIPADLRDALIACAYTEMTSNNNDLTSDWAKEALLLVVELCGFYPKYVMNALLSPITSNALPHFYVVQAIADTAEAHALRILPSVKETIAKLLPIVSLAKQDNHRMVFAQAFGSIADAVLRCAEEDTEGANVCREDYADSMYSAIQFFLGDWSRSSEVKVRIPVVYALGAMTAICTDANRVSLLSRVLPLVLAGVKREKARDTHFPARGLMAMLTFVSDEVSLSLQPQMDSAILPQLFQSIASVMGDKEYSANGGDVKRALTSLLGAAERVAEFYFDGLTTFVSRMLDAKSVVKDPALRASAIQVLRHLISRPSLEPRLEPYKDNVLATIKLAINEADWRVRQAVASCVVAMGNSNVKFFETMGGPDLLSYIVRCAAVTDTSNGGEELRDQARNTLALFSAMPGGKLDHSLWPFLMEHFNDHAASPNLLSAFPTVCRCLVQVGSRMSQTENYYVDFSVSVNVPKPHQLAAKFLVQAMQVDHYSLEELHTILEAMSTIAPLLDDPFSQNNGEEMQTPIASSWLGLIPELQKVVLAGEETTIADWEDAVSKLVTKTMTCRQSEQWVEDVTSATLQQLRGYQGHATMYRGALVVIGIGLGRSSKKDFVNNTTDYLIDAANHENQHHREGLAKAFGYIGALHPDLVSDRLTNLSKGPEKRGFFASKDKNKKELVEASRSIAAFGFCFAARRMQQTIFSSRLEAVILPALSTILNDCKQLDVREAVMEACTLLDAPLKKQATAGGAFLFKGRDSFLDTILKSVPVPDGKNIQPSKQLLQVTLAAMKAMHVLISSAPNPVVAPTISERICTFLVQFVTRGFTQVDADYEEKCRVAACALITSLFYNNTKVDVDVLVPPFMAQSVSSKDVERERSVVIVVRLLEACAQRTEAMLAEGLAVQHAVTIGPLLGRLVPRMMDTSRTVRLAAVEGVEALLRLIGLLLPDMVTAYSVDIEGCVQQLSGLKERLSNLVRDKTQSSEKEVAAITKQLCIQIVTALPEPKQFSPLLDTLLAAGITDPQDDAASCSCVVLHGMIRGLGATIPETDARRHLDDLLDAVDKVKHREQSLQGILVSIRNVAKHHSLMSFNTLLKFEVPHTDAAVKSFQAIAADASLSTMLIQHCLDLVLNSQLVEERPDPKDKKRMVRGLANIPLAAICGFGWMCQVPKGVDAAIEHRADIYGAIILYITALHEQGELHRLPAVVASLKHMIAHTAYEVTIDRMEKFGWNQWDDAKTFPRATRELVKYLCREELGDSTEETDRGLTIDAVRGLPLPPSEPTALGVALAQFILPYANKPIKSHRRAAIHCCTTLLQHSVGERKLLQSLATALLSRSGSDEDAVIRAETLESFPYICVHEYGHAQVYVSPMLSALIANFPDSSLRVSTAAMQSTCDLLDRISEKEQVSPIAVNIILKAKPLFESKEKAQRCLAFDILSIMLRLGNEGHIDAQTMEQQVYLHLLTLMLHCEEDDEAVLKSAKIALHESAKWIVAFNGKSRGGAEGATALRDVFAKPLVQLGAKMNFEDFASDFCFVWIAHFPGKVNDLLVSALGFFQVEREVLRGAAVVVCGSILKHLPPEDMGRAHVDQLCNALIAALNPSKEKSAMVRGRAAKALGLLSEL
ncbi:Hypothetical protein, putative [Bodo saltans]|uniref:Uncharacterized protein n=1 Tax=Bodo saltans TaxID=75058 RepID=A0A0S4IQJ4_BODSA|nr:Hypothetical protein, putative [Bodo saltans]|eukprot:CUE89705.1 Hypothetical protein, putative [Bodo saltans]